MTCSNSAHRNPDIGITILKLKIKTVYCQMKLPHFDPYHAKHISKAYLRGSYPMEIFQGESHFLIVNICPYSKMV
jgi:hypothetical protein